MAAVKPEMEWTPTRWEANGEYEVTTSCPGTFWAKHHDHFAETLCILGGPHDTLEAAFAACAAHREARKEK